MTEKCCGTCKWFALERGKERSGACLSVAGKTRDGSWRYRCVCSNAEACCYHEERTDSVEKLVRKMLRSARQQANSQSDDDVFAEMSDKIEEYEKRARALGIEVD